MPYPTDVTEPRLGVDAFAQNDAASQMAQAAFLLLLGYELKRSRKRSLPSKRGTIEAPPDEDTALFRMPQIAGGGRRYRFSEVAAMESLPPGTNLRRQADRYELSRDIAYRLQIEPSESLAAALLLVCVTRSDSIVRVAAAAAGMEITAEPMRLIGVLARGTRDDDPLVRDLSATALARVYPEHSALRRLASRSRRKASAGTARTSLLVHGTFARNQPWWQPGGDFHSYALASVLPDLYAAADRFEWSGGYSDAARMLGGQDLEAWASSHSAANPLIIGHSHGANVIFLATQMGVSMREAVLLSCPVHWPQYAPDFSKVGKVVSVRVHLDLVILADFGGQRFDDPRIAENVLGVWFNHSATHEPAIWQQYDVPTML